MTHSDEEQQISELVARLAARFPDLTVRFIGEVVHGVHRDFEGHRVREFIPLLVERISERHLHRRMDYATAAMDLDDLLRTPTRA
ncbi:three-helix bundle dimerization domain-containing protein [Nocardia sp. NPDC005825]|uniref:three-helix bundle dimerization domain-containing protein n=1 Tax=unclassified Nocardia TaxID=2637762 RepID=UPI0033E7A51E